MISLQSFFVLLCHDLDLKIQTVGGGNSNSNLHITIRQFGEKLLAKKIKIKQLVSQAHQNLDKSLKLNELKEYPPSSFYQLCEI